MAQSAENDTRQDLQRWLNSPHDSLPRVTNPDEEEE